MSKRRKKPKTEFQKRVSMMAKVDNELRKKALEQKKTTKKGSKEKNGDSSE